MRPQRVVDHSPPVSPEARPRPYRRAAVPTDAYRFSRSLLVVLLVLVLDIRHYFVVGGSLRYLLLTVPIGSIALMRLRVRSTLIRRPALSDRVLFLLWLFGLVGTLYGILALRSETTGRPLFLPMTIAFLYVFVLDLPTDREIARLLRGIAWIGTLYIIVVAVVHVGLITAPPRYSQFLNAEYAFVALGIAGAIVLRRRLRLGALVALVALSFIAYPSATSVLGMLAIIVTLFMTRPTASSARAYLVAGLATFGILVAVLDISRTATVANGYLAYVGKSNSVYTRLALWHAGLEQFDQSPLVGRAFAGGTLGTALSNPSRPVAGRVRLTGSEAFRLPYHNDYVLFLAEGGMVGFSLFVGWILLFEATLIRWYRASLRSGQIDRAALLRVLLATLNVFVVVMVANPVVEQVARSTTLFAIYALAMIVGPPSRFHRPFEPHAEPVRSHASSTPDELSSSDARSAHAET
jgi:hypothetical protein